MACQSYGAVFLYTLIKKQWKPSPTSSIVKSPQPTIKQDRHPHCLWKEYHWAAFLASSFIMLWWDCRRDLQTPGTARKMYGWHCRQRRTDCPHQRAAGFYQAATRTPGSLRRGLGKALAWANHRLGEPLHRGAKIRTENWYWKIIPQTHKTLSTMMAGRVFSILQTGIVTPK